ncbi:MAG: S8 family serine peptidase [Limisphaerales bacterium]
MKRLVTTGLSLAAAGLFWMGMAAGAPVADEGRLEWRTKGNEVNADFRDWPVRRILEAISASTGWEVYVEPGLSRTMSARFSGLKTGEALSRLLGAMSYAVVPSTNGPVRLYVFQTSMQTATDLIVAATDSGKAKSTLIANELIVVLRPDSKESIEEIARRLGAQVVGRAPGINAYRLRFPDADSTERARRELAANSEVDMVGSNYVTDRPSQPGLLGNTGAASSRVRPKLDGDRVRIGMVDTSVQTEGSNLRDFIEKTISLAGAAPLSPDEPLHGTAMAEQIIAAGAAALGGDDGLPFKLVVADVFGAAGTTSTFELVQALHALAAEGVPVINMSVGGNMDTPILRNTIVQLSRQGVVILASTGNEPVTTPTYPAAYPEVIAITALTANGQLAPYANRGDFVDGGAPGSAIVPFAGQAYYVSGTSVATANGSGVAGAIAISSGQTGASLDALVRQALALRPPDGQ